MPLAVVVLLGVLMPLTAAAAEKEVKVEIADFAYSPKILTVTPGTTVTWVNHDDDPHTVTATGTALRSKALDTDEVFTFTFTESGDYNYFCKLHPHMTGEVIVKPAPG